MPALPLRPAPLPERPAPAAGPLPTPLDAQHRALPAPDPLIDPLPSAAPAAPAAPASAGSPASPAIPSNAPDRAGVHPIPPALTPTPSPSLAPEPAAVPALADAADAPAPAARSTDLLPAARPSRPHRNPRVLAALAYALPLLPALVLLVRERRNRFVRVHAAQALVFYLLVAGWQIALFFAAVGVGAAFRDLHTDVLVALAFIAAFILLALLSLLLWLRLLFDAMSGQRTLFPLVSLWAERIERLTARSSRVPSDSTPVRKNVPVP